MEVFLLYRIYPSGAIIKYKSTNRKLYPNSSTITYGKFIVQDFNDTGIVVYCTEEYDNDNFIDSDTGRFYDLVDNYENLPQEVITHINLMMIK